MTPREIAIEAHGFNERAREQNRQNVTIARLQAWMVRCDPKSFPTLAQLLPGPPLTRKQYAAQQRDRMDELKRARDETLRKAAKKQARADRAKKGA